MVWDRVLHTYPVPRAFFLLQKSVKLSGGGGPGAGREDGECGRRVRTAKQHWVRVCTLGSWSELGCSLASLSPIYPRGLALWSPGWVGENLWEYSAEGPAVGTKDLNVTAKETEEERPTVSGAWSWFQGRVANGTSIGPRRQAGGQDWGACGPGKLCIAIGRRRKGYADLTWRPTRRPV